MSQDEKADYNTNFTFDSLLSFSATLLGRMMLNPIRLS